MIYSSKQIARVIGKSVAVIVVCECKFVKDERVRRIFFPEKPLRLVQRSLYRKPTQVGKHKCAKVIGRILEKELGKKAVVTSGYDLPALCFAQGNSKHEALNSKQILNHKLQCFKQNNIWNFKFV